MSGEFKIKRGDTYIFDAQVQVKDEVTGEITGQDITNWTIRSHIRFGGKLISTCSIEKTEPLTGKYRITIPEGTNNWPTVNLEQDIEYVSSNGQIISTETFTVSVVKDITLAV